MKKSLKQFTTMGFDCEAEEVIELEKPDNLLAKLKEIRSQGKPYILIAGGSNVVFCCKKYKGTVLVFKTFNKKYLALEKNLCLVAPASLWLDEIVAFSVTKGLAGLVSLSGIPGTIGGAVFGNAGAYGHSISEVVEAVEIWDGKKRRWLDCADCRFDYRDSIFKKKDWIILQVKLKLKPGQKELLKKQRAKILKYRREKFFGLRCPGSYFKNVLVKKVTKQSLKLIDHVKIIDGKIPAGYLLEEVGAKGLRQGGIFVADYHGNLIINDGTGTYRDLSKLARRLKDLVFKKFVIKLEEEVRSIV